MSNLFKGPYSYPFVLLSLVLISFNAFAADEVEEVVVTGSLIKVQHKTKLYRLM
ncbi:MAG: hypothetical protein CM1200mP12_16710 [Gammaproteobacteria bacterium]|nr:MAG: hypothetical protein CM1200mP12_16710 [Gammaproteobacteria bacterium]